MGNNYKQMQYERTIQKFLGLVDSQVEEALLLNYIVDNHSQTTRKIKKYDYEFLGGYKHPNTEWLIGLLKMIEDGSLIFKDDGKKDTTRSD